MVVVTLFDEVIVECQGRTVVADATVFDSSVGEVDGVFDTVDLDFTKLEFIGKSGLTFQIFGEQIEAKPYSVSLAKVKTSSSVLNLKIGAMGPKVSF